MRFEVLSVVRDGLIKTRDSLVIAPTPYEQFGANAQSLIDVDKLSVDLKSLEVPKPLSPELITPPKPAQEAVEIVLDVASER